MTWTIGVIAVIGFAYLMYANERFRTFGFGLIALAAVLIGLIWLYSHNQDREWKQHQQEARDAIPHDDVLFRNLVMGGYGGSTLSGMVYNRGRYQIESMLLTVRLKDCQEPEGNVGCVTVGEDQKTIWINVPSGQARQFARDFVFEATPPVTGHRMFSVSLDEVSANIPQD